MARWLARVIGIVPLLALCLASQAQGVEEGELKAAIVFNILLFVEWPPESLPEPGAALVLCVGPNSALNAPLKGLNERPLRSHRLEVHDLPPAASAKPCHAVFVDAADRMHLAADLKAQRIAGALVVSDDIDAPHDTTAIVLQRIGSRVAFEVNLQPVRQARLQLSSKLLRLARVVRE